MRVEGISRTLITDGGRELPAEMAQSSLSEPAPISSPFKLLAAGDNQDLRIHENGGSACARHYRPHGTQCSVLTCC
jgi:hypothetical protein